MKLFKFSLNRNYRRLLVRYAKELIVKHEGCEQKSGSFSSFRKITSTWGFKYQCADCFPKDSIREIYQNYHKQRKAARVGLAPFCCGFFVFVHEGSTYACYLTQVANVRKSHEMLGQDFSYKFMYMKENEKECINHPFFCEFKRLAIGVYKLLGRYWWDCKADNFGYINGCWVIIDWGNEGLYDLSNPWNEKQIPLWFKQEVGMA